MMENVEYTQLNLQNGMICDQRCRFLYFKYYTYIHIFFLFPPNDALVKITFSLLQMFFAVKEKNAFEVVLCVKFPSFLVLYYEASLSPL